MNKDLAVLILAGAMMAACSDGRQRNGVQNAIFADSILMPGDSMDTEVAENVPAEADELFDDFFFNYASHKLWQRERTVFPLLVVDGEKTTKIEQHQWKQEFFFMKQDYYTLLFDSPGQRELVHDTAMADVTVERIDLEEARVQQFLFSRRSGRWMLHEIKWQPLTSNPNAQFLAFYQRFASDSVFQHKSLASQIVFSGPDPDDDFSVINGVITPDFWDAFKPELPQPIIYNIVYGQQDPAATQKIFLLRGIANELEVEMTFNLQYGRWKLTKLMT